MASTLPTFTQQPPENYDVDADAALVQRSLYKKPGFYGNQSSSSSHQIFMLGVNTALSYAGQSARKNELVDQRTPDSPYRLTKDEYTLLQKRAASINTYTKVPYDTCEDFLIILCFVDNIQDMTKIADAVQIDQLADETILRKPMVILNIPKLEKISFAAQALDGLVNLYRRYINSAMNTVNKSSDSNDGQSILNAISSIVGGFGGAGPGPRFETGDLGNFLSELITGNRIPTNVIAKNPMMQSPSYAGKAFFGEHPNALSNVDIDQMFNKMIAVFPQTSNGAGTSSFAMQNFSSFQQAMPLTNFVSKILTGSSTISSQRKQNQINAVVEKIATFSGSKSTDIVEINRADNAIPLMMATSTALSGYDKSVFSDSTFKDGWAVAQSVAQTMYSADPQFIEAARRFL